MTIENINTQQMYEHIKKTIADTVIGVRPEKIDRSKLSDRIVKIAESYRNVGGCKVDKVGTLWGVWTWKQKVQWFWFNRLGFGEKQAQAYYDSYDRELEQYSLPKPFWIEKHPKQTFAMSFYYRPVVPIERVELQLKRLSKDEVIADFISG